MKYIVIFIAIAMSLVFSQSSVAQNQNKDNEGIVFFKGSWEEALNLAREKEKLVFLDAYASWCGPCKAMKKYSFTNRDAGEFFNENFINIQIDMERGKGPILAQRYRVKAYPTLLFIDPDGKVVQKALGYHRSKDLIRLGQKVLN